MSHDKSAAPDQIAAFASVVANVAI